MSSYLVKKKELIKNVKLPILHTDQVTAFRAHQRSRFLAVRCGRRWGKTELAKVIVGDGCLRGKIYGIFTPAYKYQTEVYAQLIETLGPVAVNKNKSEGTIRLIGGGRIDFWTLDNEDAGRSRHYDGVVLDEAAFAKDSTMMKTWRNSIQPTLLDRKGWVIACSNTNGVNPENFFWQICNEAQHGFSQHHAPTRSNPFMPADELERLQATLPPLVWQQEYLAEFVDWSGVAFFQKDRLLGEDGNPVEYPQHVDAVFATIDTALKSGQEHDGTAVTYWAVVTRGLQRTLYILDWDIIQIDGDLLAAWLPSVAMRLESLARETTAIRGSIGAWIEDKNSGTVLIQQAQRRGLRVHQIDTKLTAMGKHERALSVSGYVYQRMVQFTRPAWEKRTMYKGHELNHQAQQIFGFRMGAKDEPGTQDDLLDTFTYGISMAVGNSDGW